VIIDICKDLRIDIVEGEFDVSVLRNAQSIFLTNSISGMAEVNKFEDISYEIGVQTYKKIEENLLTRLKWK